MADEQSSLFGAEPDCEALLEATRPDMYRRNAFRVTGLPVTIDMGETKRRVRQVAMAKNLGRDAEVVQDGYLPLRPPPDEAAMQSAIRRLQDPETRLVDEFFWFWPERLKESEDEALRLLKENRIDDALKVWLRHEREGSESRVSTHNVAVLTHVAALDIEYREAAGNASEKQRATRRRCWRETYRRWRRLLGDEWFWRRLNARIRQMDDPRLTTGTARRIRACLPTALLSINARLAVQAAERQDKEEVRRQLDIMGESGCEDSLRDQVLREKLKPTLERVKTLASNLESEVQNSPAAADRAVRNYFETAWPLLATVDLVLPEGHIVRNSLHDNVAGSARIGLITYGNKTNDWKGCLQLVEAVFPLVRGTSMRSKLREDMELLFGNLCARAVEAFESSGQRNIGPVRLLVDDASPLIKSLDRLLPEEDAVRESAHNSVATVAMNCAIAYGVKTEDWATCLPILDAAVRLAEDPELIEALAGASARLQMFRRRRRAPQSRRGPHGSRRAARVAGVLFLVGAIFLIWFVDEDPLSLFGSSPGQNSAAERGTRPAEPNRPSSRSSGSTERSRRSALRQQIEAGKARLRSLELELDGLKNQLEGLSSRIDNQSKLITMYESRMSSGRAVNETDYRKAVSAHNALVDEHNALQKTALAKYAAHEAEVRRVNDLVARYNSGSK